ncbi:MAG: HDOD domain-containing protein [Nitrosomonadales bacterium]|nr:HDOD domain-containing protein [Nitrosomonadales bacterium]
MSENLQDAATPLDGLFERAIMDLGIPPCPGILDRFMAEAGKDEPDYKRLVGIIGADVALSASLIKTANSPYFGMRQRVRSVNEALAILGLKASSRAVAGIILRNAFPHVLNLERFWDASARIARVSGWLAQQLLIAGLLAEDAYTFGLFRDCGIPVLLGRFARYGETLAAANQDSVLGFTEIEEMQLPTNHAMVGCILAQSWWLPEEICLAIRNHHDVTALESAEFELPMLSRRLIATSQFAEHIVQRQLGLSLTEEWSKLGMVCLRLLEIDEARLEDLYVKAVPIVSAAE